jgi:uncharacterized protein YhfF
MTSIEDLVADVEREGFTVPAGRVSRGEFGDSSELSTELLTLIRGGGKRATAGLLWAFEAEGEPVPAPGDLEIAVDPSGRPSVVLRFTEVQVMPYDEVTEDFARAEGEGDLSLAYWRLAHWNFFKRECARIGRKPAGDMPVVCMRFEVLHLCKGREPGGRA